MTNTYKDLPDNARVWVYQSNRKLSKDEISSIKGQGLEFLQRWSAHGNKLNAYFEVFHDQFLVFFIDEEQAKATGCSIDKSVRLIKSLEREFDIALLDRDLVAYQDGKSIATCTREEFIYKGRAGILDKNTIVFNLLNLITSQALAILVAIFISEINAKVFKKVSQSIIFLP